MKNETFILENGKKGVRFKDAVFAASKNHNGAHFDPLEVFSVDQAPENFNNSHKKEEKLDGKFETRPSVEIDGKLLKFKADIVSFDDYVINNANKVTGFSPELIAVNEPARRANERFYAVGDLVWNATAILFGEKPGFIGADSFQLEKFSSADSDVILIEEFEEETKEEETFDYDAIAEKVSSKLAAQIEKQVGDKIAEKFAAFEDKKEEDKIKEIEKITENFKKNTKEMEDLTDEKKIVKGEAPVAQYSDSAIESIKKKFNF